MDEKTKRMAIVDALNCDEKNKYYVYALCEKADDKLIPFYIGKGEAYRVWDHEAGQEKEINAIKEMYEEYEWQERIEELSLKYQKITELGADKIEKVFIKFGMKENEALMAESALINLLKIGKFAFDASHNILTNGQLGHSSEGEKTMGCTSEAMTADEFYDEHAQPPIDFDDVENAVLISIHRGYLECLKLDASERNDGVREVTRGFWKLRNECPKYLYAMHEKRIVGIYRIKDVYKTVQLKRKTKQVRHLYSMLDVWRKDYPLHDKIATRTGDYELAKKIYDECEKNSDGSVSRVLPFNELSDELREYLKGTFGPLKKNQTYESVYNNLVKRKYYVVEDILDTDPDAGLRELIGRRIIERMIKDDEEIITSPIRPRNYIRYSKK